MTLNSRLDRYLGVCARIAAALLVVLGLFTLGTLWFAPLRQAVRHRLSPHAGYLLGDRIGLPADLYRATRLTVVLFASNSCSACRSAESSLKELKQQLGASVDVRFVMVSADSYRTSSGEDYARRVGFELAPRATLPEQLRAVPTIAIVDRDGRVRFVLEGAPTGSDSFVSSVRGALSE